jgi:hypothetical protein
MRITAVVIAGLLAVGGVSVAAPASPEKSPDLWDRVEQHTVDSNGVKIHYVAIGKGPLIVMIHGTYAFNFQKAGAEATLSPENLAGWVKDESARARYIEDLSVPTSPRCRER